MIGTSTAYKRHRFPARLIAYAVWLCFRFPLSLRLVEELLLERGIVVSYESIRRWAAEFGPAIARGIRRRAPRPGDVWHLDEVRVVIRGDVRWLWRAVDQHGVVLDEILQRRRDKRSAERLLIERFLSSVQIGITLIGVLAGAFGGATLAEDLAGWLETLGLRPGTAETVGVAVVVAAITYLSLIVGELVPKQIALRDPERVAAFAAPAMAALARLAASVVGLLEFSSRLVLRLLGRHEEPERRVTEEEIRLLVAEGESAGAVEPQETRMIARVLGLGDRSVRALMTPRPEVDWVDLDQDVPAALERLRASPHARLPAARGAIDEAVGVLHAKDVLRQVTGGGGGEAPDLAALVRPAPAVHDNVDALGALEALRASPVDMAFVVDEHGSFEGVVTAADLLEAIAGQFAAHEAAAEPDAARREDGSWLLAGSQPADDMAELLKLTLPGRRDYHTVAGFALVRLGRFPRLGDAFDFGGWRFEVVDIDGRRIDKVLTQPLRKPRAAAR